MNKTFISFILGACTGACTAWFYAKKKYEKIAQEEIDSVKEVFSKRGETKIKENDVPVDKERYTKDKPSFIEYATAVREEGYTDYNDVKKSDSNDDKSDIIYVISPDEFGEIEDYEQISLTYYADNILTDDNDDVIDEVEETIGSDALNHFGEYEDDSVFVRNQILKCDFEILLDQRNYADVEQHKPLTERRFE